MPSPPSRQAGQRRICASNVAASCLAASSSQLPSVGRQRDWVAGLDAQLEGHRRARGATVEHRHAGAICATIFLHLVSGRIRKMGNKRRHLAMQDTPVEQMPPYREIEPLTVGMTAVSSTLRNPASCTRPAEPPWHSVRYSRVRQPAPPPRPIMGSFQSRSQSWRILVWGVRDRGWYDFAGEQLLHQLRSTTCMVGLVGSNGKRFWAHAVREFIDSDQFIEWVNIGPTSQDSLKDIRIHQIELDRVCDEFVPFARKTVGLLAGSPNHHMHQLVPQE